MVLIDDVIQIDDNSGLPTLETFNALDPSELESISVLRDASAAIYGSRAVSYTQLDVYKRQASNGGMPNACVMQDVPLSV